MLEMWLTKEGTTALFAAGGLFLSLMFRESITNFTSSIWFRINPRLREGETVIIDDEMAVINKIGLRQTTFSYVNKPEGKKIWRIVPNERIKFLKLEVIVHERHN